MKHADLTSRHPHFTSKKIGSVLDVKSRLIGGFNPLKNISQWEGLSHILWKNMENKSHVPNHQPED
jgi:hypothetical protein